MRLYLQNMIDKKLVSRLNKEQLKSTRRKEKPKVQKKRPLWHRRDSSCRGIMTPGHAHKLFSSVQSLRRVPLFATPWAVAARLFYPGKNTGMGCHFFFQGISPTQGSNLGILHWKVHSSLLSHVGSHVSLG